MLSYWLTRVALVDPSIELGPSATPATPRVAQLLFDEDSKTLTTTDALPKWVHAQGVKFVAKPDQLIKRRGKAGLLALNKTLDEAKLWIDERAGKVQKVSIVSVWSSRDTEVSLIDPFVASLSVSDLEVKTRIVSFNTCPDSHCLSLV